MEGCYRLVGSAILEPRRTRSYPRSIGHKFGDVFGKVVYGFLFGCRSFDVLLLTLADHLDNVLRYVLGDGQNAPVADRSIGA